MCFSQNGPPPPDIVAASIIDAALGRERTTRYAPPRASDRLQSSWLGVRRSLIYEACPLRHTLANRFSNDPDPATLRGHDPVVFAASPQNTQAKLLRE